MGDFMCRIVCWAMAAGAAIVAGIIIKALLAPGAILLFIMCLFIFVILAWALPAMICSLPKLGETPAPGVSRDASNAADVTPKPAVPAAPAAAPQPAAVAAEPGAPAEAPSGAAASWTDTIGASGLASDNRGQTGLKPSVELAEEATLRVGVGTWRYEGEGAAPAAAAPAAAPATAKAAEGDYDGDGVIEGKDEGEKPATLTEARGGKPDDLKQIKGVGPKMEGLLNSLGFFHFDQVASWTDQEVAWVDANLEGFKGRVSRDSWVEQAKILAAGGETEFSKRVEDGGVY